MNTLRLLFLAFISLNLAASGQHTGIGGGNSQPEPPRPPRPSYQPQSLLLDFLDLFDEESEAAETDGELPASEEEDEDVTAPDSSSP